MINFRNASNYLNKQLRRCYFIGFFGALLTALSCGQIHLGSTSPNDTAPDGPIVASGNFAGVNDKTVTGGVQVYRLTATAQYVVRLVGITVPSENGLQVYATGGSKNYTSSLRSFTGTQNYNTGISDTVTWDTVYIRSTRNANTPYGMANLSSPN